MRSTVEMRVRGRVQGAGFHSTVWRMAMACGLDGDTRNDGDGALIRLSGMLACIDTFRTMLVRKPPLFSSIDAIILSRLDQELPHGFSILEGEASKFKIEAARSRFGRKRIVDDPVGEQLPQIC